MRFHSNSNTRGLGLLTSEEDDAFGAHVCLTLLHTLFKLMPKYFRCPRCITSPSP